MGETVFQLAESSPNILLESCCANLSDLTQSRLLYLDCAVRMRAETAVSLLETALLQVVSVNTQPTRQHLMNMMNNNWETRIAYLSVSSMVEVLILLFYIGVLLAQHVVFTLSCSTKRIDNSNSRLVSQVDKETGELFSPTFKSVTGSFDMLESFMVSVLYSEGSSHPSSWLYIFLPSFPGRVWW